MSKLSKFFNNPKQFFSDSRFFPGTPNEKKFSEVLLHRYIKYLVGSPVEPKTIFYESFHGNTMSCNPLAVFRALVDDPAFSEYRHIWALNEMDMCRPEYRRGNVEFVKVHSKQYLKAICTAKYLINNTSFPPYFSRRPEQIYVNTWHGTPLKTLGKDMRGSAGQHKNILRNLLHSTHILSPNRFTGEILVSSHEIDGIYAGKILESGYPRVDITLSTPKERILARLKLSGKKPVLLFAPTWRGEVGDVTLDDERLSADLKYLNDRLGKQYEILFRGHVLTQKHLQNEKLPCKIVPSDIDTAELLAGVDFLVTDYSSIFFDYLVLKRPMALYTYDEEMYERDRGFYFSIDEVPAYRCKTIEEISDCAAQNNWHSDFEKKYERFKDRFLYLDDGLSTKRFINAVFKQSDEYVYHEKPHVTKRNLLFYCGGFRNNGITTSALNLFQFIDYEKYNVVLVDGAQYNEEKEQNLRRLHPNVKKVLRFGSCNTLSEERKVLKKYYTSGHLSSSQEKVVKAHFNRESRRLFGDTTFDVVVDFSGYVKFWTLMFALSDAPRKIIYQHNDMLSENDKIVNGKYKHRENFKVIFDTYRFFDKIVAVSEPTMQLNKRGLEHSVPDASRRFEFVHNSIDYRQIREQAEVNTSIDINGERFQFGSLVEVNNRKMLPLFAKPDPTNINFVHVGRFSPEKRHDKLLRAFAVVAEKFPRCRLYLLGDGVLFYSTKTLASQLNIVDNVVFTGQISNPYSMLKQCDCFVLSSDHEGQPMVLLEALVVGLPVIATNIVGSRSVLEDGLGTLVDNSIDGLVEGMTKFIEGKIKPVPFNVEQYQKSSMEKFYHVVCGQDD
ncbi:MAG: CDP-glycerol glycerophosphotransferase family protein [Deltaproteobacteria bacterium]|nr:CDP-glycerol glycerophosphotransferase family protein [Deltaproteobacteria bacterium]